MKMIKEEEINNMLANQEKILIGLEEGLKKQQEKSEKGLSTEAEDDFILQKSLLTMGIIIDRIFLCKVILGETEYSSKDAEVFNRRFKLLLENIKKKADLIQEFKVGLNKFDEIFKKIKKTNEKTRNK